jgi:hypothetical protein
MVSIAMTVLGVALIWAARSARHNADALPEPDSRFLTPKARAHSAQAHALARLARPVEVVGAIVLLVALTLVLI